jgi:hypothetical protein
MVLIQGELVEQILVAVRVEAVILVALVRVVVLVVLF